MKTRRQRLGALLEAAEQMLWGSLVGVYRKCGKPTCHCTTGEKHGPVWYLSSRDEGRTRMRFVPAEHLDAAREGVEAFHRYRTLGQRVAAENLAQLERQRGRRRRSR